MGTGLKILEDGVHVDTVWNEDPPAVTALREALRGDSPSSERASDVSPAPSVAGYDPDDPQGETFAVSHPDITARSEAVDATFGVEPVSESDGTAKPKAAAAKKATVKKSAAKPKAKAKSDEDDDDA